MNKIYYFLAALLLLGGCSQDNSSVSDSKIGVITITGIENSYNCFVLADELTITPTVTSSDPNDDVDEFEYLWTYHIPKTSAPYPIDTLYQYGKDIVEWLIDMDPGTYALTLKVTNPANNYAVYATASMSVSTQFSTGYYFLKETADGNTELDFFDENGAMAPNLLEKKAGGPIIGKPARLSMFEAYTYPDPQTGEVRSKERALFPMGGRDMKVLRVADMEMLNDHASIFYDGVKPDEKPLFGSYTASSGNHMWFSNRGCYFYPTSYAESGKVGHPIAPADGCDFTGGVSLRLTTGTSSVVLFDDLNDRLVVYNNSGVILSLSSDNGFPPTGITHHLLFIGTTGWAVFEDDTDPSVRYIYQINHASASIATRPILGIRRIDATAPNFNKADVYGSNKTAAVANVDNTTLYAGVGDKFYAYNTGSHTETLISPAGMGDGEQITMITHKPGVPNPKNPSDTTGLLMVGTYKDGNYKVYMYSLSGGVPSGEPALVLTGTGKVADMQYLNPAVTMRNNTNY